MTPKFVLAEVVLLLRDTANLLESNALHINPMAVNDAMNIKKRCDALEEWFENIESQETLIRETLPGLAWLLDQLEQEFK